MDEPRITLKEFLHSHEHTLQTLLHQQERMIEAYTETSKHLAVLQEQVHQLSTDVANSLTQKVEAGRFFWSNIVCILSGGLLLAIVQMVFPAFRGK